MTRDGVPYKIVSIAPAVGAPTRRLEVYERSGLRFLGNWMDWIDCIAIRV